MQKKTKMVTISELRTRIVAILSEVKFTGNRVEIWRNGKRAAALVSVDDLERLEAAERKSAVQLEHEMRAKIEAWRRLEG
ncbi:MAG: type II toxin-antitoxin system Phd/YefM family antitoxin [Alphaproteobacteria bacterium]|nr:type II toxin-antitoxin system Phd/YefM family antitoxin [Alphaproteobacteria bacterium]